MVLSPGHRKQLGMILDLMAHKNPVQPDRFSGTPRLNSLQHRVDVIGTRRQSQKDRISAELNSNNRSWQSRSRTFAWTISYDWPSGKYLVMQHSDVDTNAYEPTGKTTFVGKLTKDEVLRRLDDKRLVDLRIPFTAIGKRWEADQRILPEFPGLRNTVEVKRAYAKQLKLRHAALTTRQSHLANVMRAVGGRRDRARRAKVVMMNEMFKPRGSGYIQAKKRYIDAAESSSPKRQRR
jgi:hypothetical protein